MAETTISTITTDLQEIIARALVRDYNFDNCPQYVSAHQEVSGVTKLVYNNIAISGLTWAKDTNNDYYIVFDIAIPYNPDLSGSNCVLKLHSKNNKVLAETDPFPITITQGQTYIAQWKINIFSSVPPTQINSI